MFHLYISKETKIFNFLKRVKQGKYIPPQHASNTETQTLDIQIRQVSLEKRAQCALYSLVLTGESIADPHLYS